MATVHISEAAAARDFTGLMARVRAGEEIIIDSGSTPVAIIRLAGRPMDGSVTATIARLKAREDELGHPITMGADYADDLEEIVNNRKPRDTSAWD